MPAAYEPASRQGHAARLCATFSLTSWPKNTISRKGRRFGGFFDFPVPETHIMSGSALYETFARAPLA
ncbi:hypothetical protein, partial [Mesorhizobium sp. M4A.F.Ca.ET.090.04.2.1]|uniref:hypothetical protein n=1 Tax=Mesorhizobium sp. M4A.F.Ca.ET.090.04.2.1 TaxID=2496663 RepID=UPI001AED0A8E